MEILYDPVDEQEKHVIFVQKVKIVVLLLILWLMKGLIGRVGFLGSGKIDLAMKK